MSKRDAGDFHYQGLPSPNGTIVPDDVFDVLAPKLTEAELRVLLYVVRRTFGFKKERDAISISQMTSGIKTREGKVLDAGTGMSKSAVWRGVQGLVRKGVLQVQRALSEQGDYETNVYSLRFRGQPEGADPEASLSDNRGVSLQKNYPSSPKEPPVSLQKSRQQTVPQETVEQQHGGVVEQLTEFGMTKAVARQLAYDHSQDYLLAKLDLVSWLQQNRPKVVGENPAGFLRKAIQEDYQPPPAYKSPEQRQAEADQAQARQEQRAKELELEQGQERAQAEQEQALRDQARAALLKEHPPAKIPGTELTTETAWQTVLDLLSEQMSQSNFSTYLKETMLVSCAEKTAVVAAPYRFHVEHIAKLFATMIEKELEQVLGFRVSTKYLAISELEKGNGQPPPKASQAPSLAPP